MTKSIKPLIQAIFVLSIILFVSQFLQSELVFHRSHIEHGQLWRIVSGNLTHSNYPHLFLNLASLWIYGFLFIDSVKIKSFIYSILFLSVFVGGCLYFFNPDLFKYYGVSGVLYGLYISGATSTILKKDYFTGFSILLVVAGKIIWDVFNGGSASSAELIGIPVATDAHFYGLAGGMLVSGFLLVLKNKLFYTHPP